MIAIVGGAHLFREVVRMSGNLRPQGFRPPGEAGNVFVEIGVSHVLTYERG